MSSDLNSAYLGPLLGGTLALITLAPIYYFAMKEPTFTDHFEQYFKETPDFKLWFMVTKDTCIPSELISMLEKTKDDFGLETYDSYIIHVTLNNVYTILKYSNFFDKIKRGYCGFSRYE